MLIYLYNLKALQRNRTHAMTVMNHLSNKFKLSYLQKMVRFAEVEAEIGDAFGNKTIGHRLLETLEKLGKLQQLMQQEGIT